MVEKLIEIKDVFVEYTSKKGVFSQVETIKAVNGVSLDIKKNEILALAGESGCGKSTLAKALLKLEKIKSGKVLFEDKNINSQNKFSQKDFRKKAQMIFQNPYSSLNPKMKIYKTLSEPLEINTNLNKNEIEKIVLEKLHQVGLNEDCLDLYPHEFSGGQRQRIAIARALMLSPEFILADEPVSALDVSIQAQIINLLKDLKNNFNITFLLITHDMGVIKYLADRVAIMYLGEIVEIGRTKDIFSNPKHPYTQALLNAIPDYCKKNKKEVVQLKGELPSPANLPLGCKFHTRCSKCMEICKNQQPQIIDFENEHKVKCFLYEK